MVADEHERERERASCSMCAAVAGAAAMPVFADTNFLAFLDCEPTATGHVIVTTREHIHYIDEVPAKQAHQFLALVERLSAAISAVTGGGSTGIFLTDGEADFRAAPHVHAHVFPKRRPGIAPAPNRELADALRRSLGEIDLSDPALPDSPGRRSVFWHDVRTPLSLSPE